MRKIKQSLKRILPRRFLQRLLPFYHLLRAIAANVIYGFPARGMRVIGVTGTNGKTTAAAMAAAVLEEAGYKVGLSTTALFQVGGKQWDNELNMTTTDPFALQKLIRRMRNARVDWIVMEVTSHALSQYRVWGVPFEVAVMTNLTQDHLDYHGSMQRYAAAKAKLLKKARDTIILNADDDWFEYFQRQGKAEKTTYGTADHADVRLQKAKLTSKESLLHVRLGDTESQLTVHLPGKFNAYNALAAAACCWRLGITEDIIQQGVGQITAVPGRMERIETGQQYAVVVDYAHTADALEKLFETLRPVTKGRLIAVFGATGDRDASKRPDMGQIASLLTDIMIVTDDEPYSEDPARIRRDIMKGVETHAETQVHEIGDRRQAIRKALALAQAGDTVAILGMGHQKFRMTNDGKIEWDDREVARGLLSELKGQVR